MKRICLIPLLVVSLVFNGLCQQQNPKTDSVLLDYYQSQRYQDAAVYLAKSYAEPLSNPKILAQFAFANSMASKLPVAEEFYRRIYVMDTASVPSLLNLASVVSRRGQKAKAIRLYKKALNLDTTNFTIYKQLALISASVNDISGSFAYLQKANKINPSDPDVAATLASRLVSLHFNKQAESVVDEALTADSTNNLLRKEKAHVLYVQAKYDAIIDLCKSLLADDGRSSSIISYKGISEYYLKRYGDCIQTFAMLDSMNIHDETGYYYTGISYKMLNDQPKAIHYLQKAIDEGISANTTSYYSEVADSYDKLHMPKKAVAAYQRALTFGDKPMIYYALASVYDSSMRDTLNAIRYYRKYLRSAPVADKKRTYIEYTSKRLSELSR